MTTLYVEDLLIAENDPNSFFWIKDEPNSWFGVKNFGEAYIIFEIETVLVRKRNNLY